MRPGGGRVPLQEGRQEMNGGKQAGVVGRKTVTYGLRRWARASKPYAQTDAEGWLVELDQHCDAIDALHVSLEVENAAMFDQVRSLVRTNRSLVSLVGKAGEVLGDIAACLGELAEGDE